MDDLIIRVSIAIGVVIALISVVLLFLYIDNRIVRVAVSEHLPNHLQFFKQEVSEKRESTITSGNETIEKASKSQQKPKRRIIEGANYHYTPSLAPTEVPMGQKSIISPTQSFNSTASTLHQNLGRTFNQEEEKSAIQPQKSQAYTSSTFKSIQRDAEAAANAAKQEDQQRKKAQKEKREAEAKEKARKQKEAAEKAEAEKNASQKPANNLFGGGSSTFQFSSGAAASDPKSKSTTAAKQDTASNPGAFNFNFSASM